MILLATMALNQGLKEYHGLMEKGVNFWETAKHFWVDRSVGSMTDYYVSDGKGKWFPYFRGGEDMVSYVSLAPLAGDLPVVVWITKEREDNGKYVLLYRESPVDVKNMKDLDGDYTLDRYKKIEPVVIMEGLEKLRFRYYGLVPGKGVEEWSVDFDGAKRFLLPGVIEMEYVLNGKKEVLLFGSHVNSTWKANYSERLQ